MDKERLETVALFGGSFDPPHFGHREIVKKALEKLPIDRLIIVPTFLNPFKKYSYSTPYERLEMSKEIFQEFSKVEISDYEIKESKATTTAQTLNYFQKYYSVKYIIIGADNLNSIEKWYNFELLNRTIIWVIASRVGYSLITDKLRAFKILDVDVDISSTDIRNRQLKENL